jgi:hypothetical protein
MPYTGNGPTGTLANTNRPGPQLANNPYTKIESMSDLVLPASPDFKYSPELNTVLHAGKCPNCIHFSLHIIMPDNCAKFLCTTSAHSDAVMAPLHTEVEKLTQEAHIQRPKKLIHNRSNFACKLNYGPGNEVKPMGISGNKGRYHILCYPKDQNLSHS